MIAKMKKNIETKLLINNFDFFLQNLLKIKKIAINGNPCEMASRITELIWIRKEYAGPIPQILQCITNTISKNKGR